MQIIVYDWDKSTVWLKLLISTLWVLVFIWQLLMEFFQHLFADVTMFCTSVELRKKMRKERPGTNLYPISVEWIGLSTQPSSHCLVSLFHVTFIDENHDVLLFLMFIRYPLCTTWHYTMMIYMFSLQVCGFIF